MIIKPGFFPDLPEAEYHSIPALSRSTLVRLARSPAHSRVPVYETPAMTMGTALHCAVLEPERYAREYVMPPNGLRLTTKEGKAWKLEQGDNTVLPRGGRGTTTVGGVDIEGMVKAIRQHEEASILLAHGVAEISAFAEHPDYKFLMKCRCDFLTDGGPNVIELKTTTDVRLKPFAKKIADMHYHYHVFYLDILTLLTNIKHENLIFVCCETKEPWGVAVYQADDEMLEIARDEIDQLLPSYERCLSSDKWPAYQDKLQPIKLPHWAKPKMEY